MSAVPRSVTEAVEVLCARFESGDYNPTPLIDIGALIANADGVVDEQEIDTLRRILEPMLGAEIGPEIVRFLIDASVRVIQAVSWDLACAKALKTWAASAGAYIKLEDHYDSVTFIQGGRSSIPPNLKRRPVATPRTVVTP